MLKTLQLAILMLIQVPAFCSDTVPDFSAVYDNRKNIVKIRCQNSLTGIKTFIIQRSPDNINWTDIALQQSNRSDIIKSFYFEDKKAGTGQNYYRLKYIGSSDQVTYTKAVMVITSSNDEKTTWVMYPVPVKDVLTLQYRGSEPIKGVITVLIQTSSGNIITRMRNSSLSTNIQVPVSNLGAGIYDVRIVIENEIVWNQRFIK
jgi:type IX secretion system substrate protein